MSTRALVKVGVAVPLLVALLFLVVASQNGALRTLSHDRAGSAPVITVPAENATGKATQALPRSESLVPAPNAGNRPVPGWSGGPADAGPDVVYQVQTTTANSDRCGPRPCRRP